MKFLNKFRNFLILLACVGFGRVKGQGHSHWTLPSEAYSEGQCISPQVVNVDVNWIIQQRTFYVPIASQFALHRYSETLLSRPSSSEEEMSTMCLTVEASQSGAALNLTNVGYDDREFRQTCTPGSEPGKINCFAAGSSAGVNPTKTRATENFIVAWDARTYMIIVRCVDGFFRDFSVFSTRPAVSHDVLHSVLNITKILGFDERRIQTMTYDTCLRNSAGLNFSNFQLNNRKTGPFTNNVLAAPFANVPRRSTVVVQQQGPQSYARGIVNQEVVPQNAALPPQHSQAGPVDPNAQPPYYPQVQGGQFPFGQNYGGQGNYFAGPGGPPGGFGDYGGFPPGPGGPPPGPGQFI